MNAHKKKSTVASPLRGSRDRGVRPAVVVGDAPAGAGHPIADDEYAASEFDLVVRWDMVSLHQKLSLSGVTPPGRIQRSRGHS